MGRVGLLGFQSLELANTQRANVEAINQSVSHQGTEIQDAPAQRDMGQPPDRPERGPAPLCFNDALLQVVFVPALRLVPSSKLTSHVHHLDFMLCLGPSKSQRLRQHITHVSRAR